MTRILTSAEAAYCQRHAAADERIAGRFAAKEAILKALGTGAIERRLRSLNTSGTTRCHLSISHQGGYAVAFAVIETL